jgi:hypothetical protein
MVDDTKKVDEAIETLDNALEKLKTVGQGRTYTVGTKVIYRGQFGVVTALNKGSADPAGSTVDLRLDDGTTVENVKVASTILKFFRQ